MCYQVSGPHAHVCNANNSKFQRPLTDSLNCKDIYMQIVLKDLHTTAHTNLHNYRVLLAENFKFFNVYSGNDFKVIMVMFKLKKIRFQIICFQPITFVVQKAFGREMRHSLNVSYYHSDPLYRLCIDTTKLNDYDWILVSVSRCIDALVYRTALL